MARYRITRTATVFQYKYVEASEDAHDEDIVDASWDIPWQEAKVIDTDGIEVERDEIVQAEAKAKVRSS